MNRSKSHCIQYVMPDTSLLRFCPLIRRVWRIDRMRATAVSLLFLFAFSLALEADEYVHRTVVHFPMGQSAIDSSFLENRYALDSLQDIATSFVSDSTVTITGVHFEGYASPEGSESLNRRLARERRLALERYVRAYIPFPDSISSAGTDIFDAAIASAYAGASPGERSRMVRNFDYLRYASVDLSYRRTVIPEVQPYENTESEISSDSVAATVLPDTVTAYSGTESTIENPLRHCRPLYIGLKTNMLYDALLIPTLGAEVYVGRDFSISGQWSYAWWSKNARHRYWRFYGGDLGVRWWFGKQADAKPLTGHHVGVYAQILTYDFETGGRGQMGAKFNYGGGIEYGFSLPVGRRLNIDFSVGAGYIGGKYYEYKPLEGHYVWQATKNRRWFGPTKAEISLVWLIGCNNRNVKGGVE